MKANATPEGGQATSGQVLRLKRFDAVEQMLREAGQSDPEICTTLRLYCEAVAAIDALAFHAAGSAHFKSCLAVAWLTYKCVETALQVAKAQQERASGSVSGTEDCLELALAYSVQEFAQAVEAQPERFINAARNRLYWPVLWAVKDNAKHHRALAEKLQLGANWPLKAKGAINLSGYANAAVANCIGIVRALGNLFREDDPELPYANPTLRPLGGIEFPRLTQEPASIAFWWNKGIKPVLEANRKALLEAPGALADYLTRANKAKEKSCSNRDRKDDPYRAKVETLAWNRFLRDCKKALFRLAQPVTDKTRKKP